MDEKMTELKDAVVAKCRKLPRRTVMRAVAVGVVGLLVCLLFRGCGISESDIAENAKGLVDKILKEQQPGSVFPTTCKKIVRIRPVKGEDGVYTAQAWLTNDNFVNVKIKVFDEGDETMVTVEIVE